MVKTEAQPILPNEVIVEGKSSTEGELRATSLAPQSMFPNLRGHKGWPRIGNQAAVKIMLVQAKTKVAQKCSA